MTDKTEKKKPLKYKEIVQNYLDKKRWTEGSKDKYTHLSYGLFQGKFLLDKESKKEFMKLYIKAIEEGVENLSILETQKELGPIIVDIDLEIPSEDYNNKRLYSDNMIIKLIKNYIESIKIYLKVSSSNLNCCLLEKQNATDKDGTYKDGFHIMFQDLCVHTKVRHLIRNNVVKMCEEQNIFDGFLNGPEKIIDKAVVSTNSWFLYGSKKPGGQAYKLTKIFNDKLQIVYDHNNSDSENDIYDNNTLIRYLSLQNSKYSKKHATPMKEDYAESDIDAECDKQGVKTEVVKYEVPLCKEDEIRKASKLTSMLSKSRTEDYHEWLRVGLALHNIDNSLLPTWIEFSKKCSKKYKEGECEKIWKTMKNPSNGNVLTIRSLVYWAKHDDPKQFDAFYKEEFKNTMKRSLDGNTYNLAKSVHTKYYDRFVCSSIKNNIWWEFSSHRWNRIDEGYKLKILFSEDFANEYNREIAEISIKITQEEGFAREELSNKRDKIVKITEKLMNTTFKNSLLDECKTLFYDATFEQKLDSNIHLIGFENGVYDLERSEFREGRPDDYITLSTKNNYYKWTERNPYNKPLFTFFDQVLPNKAVREYFLNALCTCLSGETKEEKLYIMTGSGSNGKSLTMDLMYFALGSYYMSCPITIITRKRGQSNETSPEKVRMKGRRCGVFQETDDGEKMNIGVMKEFTGGDKVLVRDLFKGADQMIEFKPQMKYFLTCNQLPAIPSNDDGTWRRLRVISFDSKFTDEPTKPNEFLIDTTLKQKIEAWAPTFISYLIHIYNTEYKTKNYLKEPEEVMTSTKQYKMENDYYTEYIMDRITVTNDPKDVISQNALLEDFRVWYLKGYSEKFTKRPDFIKFMNKQLGEPDRNKAYKNVVINYHIEPSKSDLDV